MELKLCGKIDPCKGVKMGYQEFSLNTLGSSYTDFGDFDTSNIRYEILVRMKSEFFNKISHIYPITTLPRGNVSPHMCLTSCKS